MFDGVQQYSIGQIRKHWHLATSGQELRVSRTECAKKQCLQLQTKQLKLRTKLVVVVSGQTGKSATFKIYNSRLSLYLSADIAVAQGSIRFGCWDNPDGFRVPQPVAGN